MPPAGTVTIMFTDLVSSTELLVALGEDRFDSVRDEHDGVVGGAIRSCGGELVKNTGDGFMAVFAGAADAVAAAADIQRRIAERNAESDAPLGVRIGISAGDVTERAGDYHGIPAIEAARLCDAATGGQVLASETVWTLARSRGGHDLVPVGELDLKGLPPLATVALRWAPDAPVFVSSRPANGNLPSSLDRFVGRVADIAAVRALLTDNRLVTLTGPGGSGKSRLALEVGRAMGAEHPDGVWLVELAGLDDEQLVVETAVGALDIRNAANAAGALREHFARRHALLVLDNCEHLLDGVAPLVTGLLTACPALRLLGTSREPLRVAGEREHPVEPLPAGEATELFVERIPGGRRVEDRDSEAIDRICTALDGIPLAIELAAARLRVFSPAQLAERLDDQLAVLTRGGRTRPDRQKTLRATLDWSHDLLDDDEKVVFRRLAAFAGGFTLDTVERVVADDTVAEEMVEEILEDLVAKSLVVDAPGRLGRRLRLLEPMRQYASGRVPEDERGVLSQRHLGAMTRFAVTAAREFFVAQSACTARIREEHANIAQALEFAITAGCEVDAARIVESLAYPWYTTGQPDGLAWCERVLAVVPSTAPPRARVGALLATAMLLQDALQHERSVALLDEALQLARSAEDARRESFALIWLGRAAYYREPAGDEARSLLESALTLHRALDQPAGVGWCLTMLANVALHAEDDALARRRSIEAIRLGRASGVDQVLADGLRVLAWVDARAGLVERSDKWIAELLAIHEATGDAWQLVDAHNGVAMMAATRKDAGRAMGHLGAATGYAAAMQSPDRVVDVIKTATVVEFEFERWARAAVLVGALRTHCKPLLPPRFEPLLAQLLELGRIDDIEAGQAMSLDEAFNVVQALVRE